MLSATHWITAATTFLVVGLCITLHYEALRGLADHLPTLPRHHRRRLLILLVCLFLLHIAEIWIFGVTYYTLLHLQGFGDLTGIEVTLFDAVYFSATVYTTLGFGDIVPTGTIRFLTGTEALAGLMLITWSASYTFVEMRSWTRRDDPDPSNGN